MKFADLIEKWKTLEPGEGGSEETCRMMRQIVLDMPAFMTVIESNYRCAGMFKSYMKSALASALEKFKSGGKLSDEPAPESILSLLDHFVEQIASKQHCTTDATILRWASVGQEVNSLPPKMKFFLLSLADEDNRIQQFIRAIVTWTVKECGKKKCYILPYRP